MRKTIRIRAAALALLAAASGYASRHANESGAAGRTALGVSGWQRTIEGIAMLRYRAYEGGMALAGALPPAPMAEGRTESQEDAQGPGSAYRRSCWGEYVR